MIYFKKKFCDSFVRLLWMRYEDKVGLFSRSLKFLYSIGIIVYSFNDSVLWHLNKLGAQLPAPT